MKAHSELFALSETAAQEIRKQRLRSNEMIQVNSFWKAALRIMDRTLIESDMHMASEIFCPWSSWQREESGKKANAGHSVVDTDNKLLLANYRAAKLKWAEQETVLITWTSFTVIWDHDHTNMPFFFIFNERSTCTHSETAINFLISYKEMVNNTLK